MTDKAPYTGSDKPATKTPEAKGYVVRYGGVVLPDPKPLVLRPTNVTYRLQKKPRSIKDSGSDA